MSGTTLISGQLATAHASTTTNFTVTVAAKTNAHRYYSSGGNGYLIDGIESPFLTFIPGRTYRFTMSSSVMTSHPFRFYLDVDKNTAYTTDVTSTGTYTEIVVKDTTLILIINVLHTQKWVMLLVLQLM